MLKKNIGWKRKNPEAFLHSKFEIPCFLSISRAQILRFLKTRVNLNLNHEKISKLNILLMEKIIKENIFPMEEMLIIQEILIRE